MTVREKLESMLISNGMFESQAKEVIDLSISKLNDLIQGYRINFDSPSSDYPDIAYVMWFKEIKPIALKWIDSNIPLAWFRPMFI